MLVRKMRERMATAREGRTLLWGWVKGHSGHEWNERADQLAEEGRAGRASRRAPQAQDRNAQQGKKSGEAEPRKRVGRSRGGIQAGAYAAVIDEANLATAVRSAQWGKKAAAVRDAAERTARGLELRAEYWRTSEFSRRNARGRSAQFMERPLRQSLFGRYYVEADVEAAHPTMAATAMRWAGLEATGWSELAADAQEYRRRIVEEYRRLGCAVTTSEVKKGITILLNGGSIVRWATEAAGRPVVAESLTVLRAEIVRFRNVAQRAFPEVSAVIQDDGRQSTAEQVRSSVMR